MSSAEIHGPRRTPVIRCVRNKYLLLQFTGTSDIFVTQWKQTDMGREGGERPEKQREKQGYTCSNPSAQLHRKRSRLKTKLYQVNTAGPLLSARPSHGLRCSLFWFSFLKWCREQCDQLYYFFSKDIFRHESKRFVSRCISQSASGTHVISRVTSGSHVWIRELRVSAGMRENGWAAG